MLLEYGSNLSEEMLSEIFVLWESDNYIVGTIKETNIDTQKKDEVLRDALAKCYRHRIKLHLHV